MVLRRRRPEMPRPYRTWGYPVTPILFILFSVWLVGNSIRETPAHALNGLGVIALGVPVFGYWNRVRRG